MCIGERERERERDKEIKEERNEGSNRESKLEDCSASLRQCSVNLSWKGIIKVPFPLRRIVMQTLVLNKWCSHPSVTMYLFLEITCCL